MKLRSPHPTSLLAGSLVACSLLIGLALAIPGEGPTSAAPTDPRGILRAAALAKLSPEMLQPGEEQPPPFAAAARCGPFRGIATIRSASFDQWVDERNAELLGSCVRGGEPGERRARIDLRSRERDPHTGEYVASFGQVDASFEVPFHVTAVATRTANDFVVAGCTPEGAHVIERWRLVPPAGAFAAVRDEAWAAIGIPFATPVTRVGIADGLGGLAADVWPLVRETDAHETPASETAASETRARPTDPWKARAETFQRTGAVAALWRSHEERGPLRLERTLVHFEAADVGHVGEIAALAFDPDGRFVLALTRGGLLTGVAEAAAHSLPSPTTYRSSVRPLAMRPAGLAPGVVLPEAIVQLDLHDLPQSRAFGPESFAALPPLPRNAAGAPDLPPARLLVTAAEVPALTAFGGLWIREHETAGRVVILNSVGCVGTNEPLVVLTDAANDGDFEGREVQRKGELEGGCPCDGCRASRGIRPWREIGVGPGAALAGEAAATSGTARGARVLRRRR